MWPFNNYLPNEIRQWLAENLLLGVSSSELIIILTQQGYKQSEITKEIAQIIQHPYFNASKTIAWERSKLETTLSVLHQAEMQHENANTIQRIDCRQFSQSDFLNNYYAANRPVILTNLVTQWTACQNWTPDYFKNNYGDVDVSVQRNRNDNPNYQRDFNAYCEPCNLGKFITEVQTKSPTNDFYLAAKNNAFQNTKLNELLKEINYLPDFLDPDKLTANAFLWLGPSGTITNLHHDWANSLICQIYGRKAFRLISPSQTPLVYNTYGRFSDVDAEHPDYSEFPLYQNVNAYDFILEPGEALFVPVGWWHHVKSLDISITVTLTNFTFNNYYHWQMTAEEMRR